MHHSVFIQKSHVAGCMGSVPGKDRSKVQLKTWKVSLSFLGRGEGKKRMNNDEQRKTHKKQWAFPKTHIKMTLSLFSFQEASSEEVPEVHLEFWHR